jgi:hypothetical protein
VTTAPCSGPCNPSIFEWIGYGVLLLAAAVAVVVAYRLARWIRVRSGGHSAIVPIVVVGTGLVLALLVIPRYPRPTFVPFGVSAGLEASGEIDPIYLAGSYTVSWRLQPATGSSCHLAASLNRAADRAFVTQLVTSTESLSGDAPTIDALPAASYVIVGTSECEWRVMLTPVDP